jgi:hypothetical protein
MKRSVVSALLVLTAIVMSASIVCAAPREEIKLTTIIPDQQVLIVKKGVVGTTYRKDCAKDPNNFVKDSDLYVEGNVGIGTTNPQAKLDVNGGVRASNVILTPMPSAPASPQQGMMYYDSTNSVMRYYRGGTTPGWVNIGEGAAMETGSYAGDGVGGREITVGFKPTLVMVFDMTSEYVAYFRSDTFPATQSRDFYTGSKYSTMVTEFTNTGFKVGTSVHVNGSGDTYHWIAFKK